MSAELQQALQERILILDGAMGTQIQTLGLQEADYRGSLYAGHPTPLKGCNDLLSLTQPEAIIGIHRAFLEAGADIIETNTFNATAISMADYQLEAAVYEMNRASAALARQTADQVSAVDGKPRWVAGSMGPTNRTASLSPKVEDPAFRNVTFQELVAAYAEQAQGLLDGGVDLLLPETTFDTLNLKAALYAIETVFEKRGQRVPVIASVTITDASGRTLSGQTVEAFWTSISPFELLGVSINCALGAAEMRPYIQELARLAPVHLCCFPNAGLPNAFGGYDETPEAMATILREFAQAGWLNLAGGCCGTGPAHIQALAKSLQDCAPRKLPQVPAYPRYSGLEPLVIRPEANFILIGERTNITGSKRFARLIREARFDEALSVARQQVEGGANILDINMDEGLIDSVAAMHTFLNLIAAEPDIARVPIMIDSSRWEVLEAGLQCVQGKAIVNSISLKDGEADFLAKARTIKRYGAAVVVMAFDEEGQATETSHKVAICQRAYQLLTEIVGFAPQDIIFDPNILTVATGMAEHNPYAIYFIEAVRQIKQVCPGALTSGGVSNVSFSFRGNDPVREAIHAAFLYHAIQAGLDMGIVNAGQLAVYSDVEPELLHSIEDVLFDRHPEATETLIALAERYQQDPATQQASQDERLRWREAPLAERLAHALRHGIGEYLEADLQAALQTYPSPLAIIEGPLMDGMNIIGDLFGAGQMFLPQVVKSARVMKQAVAFLQPLMQQDNQKSQSKGKILLATVKGDVHDIGKNIVGVVLACNHYDVIDLGVMVPADRILAEAQAQNVDIIGLSGLITPSLDEMVHVASEMQRLGFELPLLIGGATTSRQHTAVRIAPTYKQPVVHVLDASRAVTPLRALLNPDPQLRQGFITANTTEQTELQARFAKPRRTIETLDLKTARARKPAYDWANAELPEPPFLGTRLREGLQVVEIIPYIDWTPFFSTWELSGTYPRILEDPVRGEAARDLFAQAQTMLQQIVAENWLQPQAVYGFFAAQSQDDDIQLQHADQVITVHTLRQQRTRRDGSQLALADWIAPASSGRQDHLGAFVVTAGDVSERVSAFRAAQDDFSAILLQALADRLAEALAEMLHAEVRVAWGLESSDSWTLQDLIKERYQGIRPAPGYPACPDHTEKRTLFALLQAERIGVQLTEHCAMSPAASVSGWYLTHPDSRYFTVDGIGADQLADYAARKGWTLEEATTWLRPWLQ